VIDVGGTHVKVLATRRREEREIPSGSNMTARKMVRNVKRVTKDWAYGLVSIGYPGPIIHGRPLHEPHNLGGGWVEFNFGKAFGCPVSLACSTTQCQVLTNPIWHVGLAEFPIAEVTSRLVGEKHVGTTDDRE